METTGGDSKTYLRGPCWESLMGARSGGRGATAGVGLLVLLLVSLAFVPVVAVGEDEKGEPVEEVLYFTQRPGQKPAFNVSTYAPEGEDNKSVRESSTGGAFGIINSWDWSLPAAPANWSVEAGDQWTVILHTSGWDEHLPVTNPLSDPDSIGQFRLEVNLTAGEFRVASGTSYIESDVLIEDVERTAIPIEFEEALDLQAEDSRDILRARISVTAQRTSSEATLNLHFRSAEHSSRIEAPGYPVEELRHWEDEFLWEQYCAEKQLDQKICKKSTTGPPPLNGPPEVPTENSTDNETAPAPAFLLVTLIGFVLFTVLAR